ncbi:MAG: hypothetical protein ACYC0H_11885 [Solirubrobacteraceae bacterium]
MKKLTCAICLAMMLAACGSSSSGPPTVTARPAAQTLAPAPTQQAVPTGSRSSRPSTPSQRVLSEINVVCVAVLHGFPAPLRRPFTARRLVRFAAAAQLPARRAAVSLARLESVGDAVALRALDSQWQQLQGLYGSIRVLSRNAHAVPGLGSQILARQQALDALAQADRLPGCSVLAGPRVSG